MSESVPRDPTNITRMVLITNHNHGFAESPTFKAAYQRE